jgi:hypothetical protein
MKITRQMPVEGTLRTRRVFALLPYWFDHGTLNEPLRTMVWLDYYLIEEIYEYGNWRYRGKRLVDSVSSQRD